MKTFVVLFILMAIFVGVAVLETWLEVNVAVMTPINMALGAFLGFVAWVIITEDW